MLVSTVLYSNLLIFMPCCCCARLEPELQIPLSEPQRVPVYVPLFHFLTISELKYAAVYCNGDFASFCTLGKAFGNVQNQGFLPTHFFNTSSGSACSCCIPTPYCVTFKILLWSFLCNLIDVFVLANIMTKSSCCFCERNSGHRYLYTGLPEIWVDCHILIYTHCPELMKSVRSHGSLSLLFVMKVMV